MKLMELEYPLARLFVYDQLIKGGQSCEQALISAAYRFGLVPLGRLDHVRGNGKDGECGSLYTVRILVEEVIRNGNGNDAEISKELVVKIIDRLERDVKEYKGKYCPSHGTAIVRDETQCPQVAPAIFDFLLQHLRAYR